MEPINEYVTITTEAGDVVIRPVSLALTANGWAVVAVSVHTGEQIAVELVLITGTREATEQEIADADAERVQLHSEREQAILVSVPDESPVPEDLTPEDEG